jgi:hypothetical protein
MDKRFQIFFNKKSEEKDVALPTASLTRMFP